MESALAGNNLFLVAEGLKDLAHLGAHAIFLTGGEEAGAIQGVKGLLQV
jgi:hypothetical protein